MKNKAFVVFLSILMLFSAVFVSPYALGDEADGGGMVLESESPAPTPEPTQEPVPPPQGEPQPESEPTDTDAPDPVVAPTGSIAFDEQSLVLEIGDTNPITIRCSMPEGQSAAFTLSSSDPAIADVEEIDTEGVISYVLKAYALGETTITATVDADPEVFATLPVKVVPTLVQSVSITAPGALSQGETASVQADVSPADPTDNTLIWSVDDAGVLAVTPDADDSMKATVTALGAGRGTLTATAADQGKIAASQSILVSGITLAPTGDIVFNLDNATVKTLTTSLFFEEADPSAVRWHCDDESRIALSADGATATLTALAATDAPLAITASYTDPASGVTYTETRMARVLPHAVTMLTILADAERIEIDETLPLGVQLLPEGTVADLTWSVDDASLASLDATEDGATLTGLAAGTVSVSVTARDGSDTTKTAYLTVEVFAPPATDLVIQQNGEDVNALAYLIGDQVDPLSAEVFPSNADQEVVWSVDNPNVARIDQKGNLTLVSPGLVNITAESKSTDGVSATVRALVDVLDLETRIRASVDANDFYTNNTQLNLATGVAYNFNAYIVNTSAKPYDPTAYSKPTYPKLTLTLPANCKVDLTTLDETKWVPSPATLARTKWETCKTWTYMDSIDAFSSNTPGSSAPLPLIYTPTAVGKANLVSNVTLTGEKYTYNNKYTLPLVLSGVDFKISNKTTPQHRTSPTPGDPTSNVITLNIENIGLVGLDPTAGNPPLKVKLTLPKGVSVDTSTGAWEYDAVKKLATYNDSGAPGAVAAGASTLEDLKLNIDSTAGATLNITAQIVCPADKNAANNTLKATFYYNKSEIVPVFKVDGTIIPSNTTISLPALKTQTVTVAFKNVGGVDTTVGFPVTLALPAGATVTGTPDVAWVQGTAVNRTKWTYTGLLNPGDTTPPLTITYLPPKPANATLTATAALPGDANSKTNKASIKFKITGYDLGVVVVANAGQYYWDYPFYALVGLYVNGSDDYWAANNDGKKPVVTVTTNIKNNGYDYLEVDPYQGQETLWDITSNAKQTTYTATFKENVPSNPTSAAQVPMLEVCYDVLKKGTYTTTASLSFPGDTNSKNNKASAKTQITDWKDSYTMQGSFTGNYYTVGEAGTATYSIHNMWNTYAGGCPVQVTFQKPANVTISCDATWERIKWSKTSETYKVNIPAQYGFNSNGEPVPGSTTTGVTFTYLASASVKPPVISAKIVYPRSTIYDSDEYYYYILDGSSSSVAWKPYVKKHGISVSADASTTPRKLAIKLTNDGEAPLTAAVSSVTLKLTPSAGTALSFNGDLPLGWTRTGVYTFVYSGTIAVNGTAPTLTLDFLYGNAASCKATITMKNGLRNTASAVATVP